MSKTTRTIDCPECQGTGDHPDGTGRVCTSCLGIRHVEVQDRPEDDDPEIGGLGNG